MRRKGLFAVAICLLLMVMGFVGTALRAETMRTWVMDDDSYHVSLTPYKLRVYNTAGTCVYLAQGYSSLAIAVIPKAQLPLGTGCQ